MTARLDPEIVAAYEGAPPPGDSTPWRAAAFSVVDLETTGLDPARDEIISFASVSVIEGRVRLDDARSGLARPGRMPDAETIRIHGLREAELAGAPPLAELLEQVLQALTGRVLVAHVAAVEQGFLGAALEPHGLGLPPVVDTAGLAARLWLHQGRRPANGPPGLSGLAQSLGLPVHRPHHADGDALTTAQALLALASHLEAFEPLTVGSMRKLAASPQRGPSALDRGRRLVRRAARRG